jgi:hypothetical protein
VAEVPNVERGWRRRRRPRRSGGGGDRRRAVSTAAEETSVESGSEETGGDLEFCDESDNEGGLLFIRSKISEAILN